ncbi:hypothetical protein DXG01_008364 [Tephrocybe rancida]|nr:hypothetical protein DXG01_008364 [Tephrocybe rancida]
MRGGNIVAKVETFSGRGEKVLAEDLYLNVEDQQYACAGELVTLQTITNVLNFLKVKKIGIAKLPEEYSVEKVKEMLGDIVKECFAKASEQQKAEGYIKLERGFATTSLPGIDVPFHSRYLWAGVAPLRAYLSKKINPTHLNPDVLVGMYIPNLIAKPFEVPKEYAQIIYDQTSSPRLDKVLKKWDQEHRASGEQRQKLACTIFTELLAYQFASPARWIETQDRLFTQCHFERFIELGPSPTLTGVATRTLKAKCETSDDSDATPPPVSPPPLSSLTQAATLFGPLVNMTGRTLLSSISRTHGRSAGSPPNASHAPFFTSLVHTPSPSSQPPNVTTLYNSSSNASFATSAEHVNPLPPPTTRGAAPTSSPAPSGLHTPRPFSPLIEGATLEPPHVRPAKNTALLLLLLSPPSIVATTSRGMRILASSTSLFTPAEDMPLSLSIAHGAALDNPGGNSDLHTPRPSPTGGVALGHPSSALLVTSSGHTIQSSLSLPIINIAGIDSLSAPLPVPVLSHAAPEVGQLPAPAPNLSALLSTYPAHPTMPSIPPGTAPAISSLVPDDSTTPVMDIEVDAALAQIPPEPSATLSDQAWKVNSRS